MHICSFLTLILSLIITGNQKLPYTLSPEYLAAQRAYMRYHNMNPIWGISSQKARAADEH
jgi:Cytochrome c oxidase subunit IV.